MKPIELFKVYMSTKAPELVSQVLQSGWIGQAQKVEDFEELLRRWFVGRRCNTLNSATSGLHLALHYAKWANDQGNLSEAACRFPGPNAPSPDDRNEVLTTPLTCTATNWPILANGLKIRWVDIDKDTCNVDLDDLERKLSHKTLAIMVVHWGGMACNLDRLREITFKCQELYGHRPIIIEDCAHAWGASWDGRLLGTHGNTCVFSFQAIKHMTTGDGGAIISQGEQMHEAIKLLRWYGLDRASSKDFRCEQNVVNWGYKMHMNDINAAIGICNLPESKAIVEKHRENGLYYDEQLKGIGGVTLLKKHSKADSSYWVYTLRVENRDKFQKHLLKNGIVSSLVHKRNDEHTCVRDFRCALPGLEVVAKDMVCIPCGWWVTPENRDHIVSTIKQGW